MFWGLSLPSLQHTCHSCTQDSSRGLASPGKRLSEDAARELPGRGDTAGGSCVTRRGAVALLHHPRGAGDLTQTEGDTSLKITPMQLMNLLIFLNLSSHLNGI